MARIPLGDFGGVVARPVERPSGDPSAHGAGVGQALQTAGSIGMRGAQNDMDQAAAEADRAKRQADADAKQLAREQAAEAKAVAKELSAARATTVQATTINDLRDLQREVAAGIDDGTVGRDKAVEHFNTRAQKIMDARLAGLDPVAKESASARLIDNIGASRLAVADLVTQRGKQELIANKDTFFEQMQRYAAGGAKEADEAIARARAYPMAGEDPKAASLRVQKFAEGVRFVQATSLVNTDPGAALKALKDPKYLPELDPGARTNLIQTADVRVTQASNRAANAAEAAARKMVTQWKALSTVFDAGKMLEPAALEAARKQFRGTPYAAALDAMMVQAPAQSAFASQPLAVQSAALMQMQGTMNTKGATPESIAQYKKLETAHNAALADYAKDPYMAAAERGVIVGVAPLSLDIQALPGQLQARAEDARKVSIAAGKEVSLFRPDEAEKIGNVLLQMPAKDRAGALVGLSKVMTPGQRLAFAAQVEPKDKALALALAYTDRQTTAGRYTSELILRGQQARADKTSTKGAKSPDATVGQWSAEFADSLSDVFPNQQTADNVREAAILISHGIAAEQGGELSKADRERALRLAVGGPVVEHNGRKIPLPAGVDEDGLAKRLRAVTAADLKTDTVRAGGVAMPAADFLKTLPGLPLMPYRSGQFTPLVGGRPVLDANGRPVLIEVR